MIFTALAEASILVETLKVHVSDPDNPHEEDVSYKNLQ